MEQTESASTSHPKLQRALSVLELTEFTQMLHHRIVNNTRKKVEQKAAFISSRLQPSFSAPVEDPYRPQANPKGLY